MAAEAGEEELLGASHGAGRSQESLLSGEFYFSALKVRPDAAFGPGHTKLQGKEGLR
jgi:hypothetical protein